MSATKWGRDEAEHLVQMIRQFYGVPVEDAARAYVAARLAAEAAEPRDWSAAAAEVDRTWHELVEAAMPPDPETGAQ